MGVPKFFRYMSERYPCLSELLRENQVPEFDNLYLDMNGIIHNCSHPNDGDISFRIQEDAIFEAIFQYVEYLFKMIRPQKVFFIAVDGVAPRAKMNQQRGRRFRSAQEATELLERAKANGDPIPSGNPFDSNCITPGTPFMVRLQHALEHFVQVKIATDPLWKACTVILSGHETPGEGEHKIMEYIRHAKAQPGFNPNLRHCLYGLDADLIMLGLCTHERYFSLLREEVKFGKNDKKTSILQDIRFYLLHLTLLSEYLELEFASIRDRLKFPFDLHKLIDDWVLMGYLVGNDFIPHIPHLHINENALPILYSAYKDVLPEMDGYINEGGILNLPRLQLLMRRLARFDRDMFLERYMELKYFEDKCGKNNLEAFDVNTDEIIAERAMDEDLAALIMASEMLDFEGEDDEDRPVTQNDIENDPELFEKEFQSYKRNYYVTKMGYADFTEEVRAEQTECYIRALQWTLHYYYRGVVSWSWYYPHHYAPFISDVDNFADLKLEFEMASPFLPFQQLLSVLPTASMQHLPPAYHDLMIDPNSSVYDFYPTKFTTDLNGKQQAWEAVVLIPFIDEKRLLKAMSPCDAFLTDEEKQRNVHGPMLQYQYDIEQRLPLEAKYGFARIDELPVKRKEIWRYKLHVSEDKLVLGPSKGAILHGYAKGFPTFTHLPHHGELKHVGVKIFNFASKNDSMVVVLDPAPADQLDTAQLAKNLLGKVVHVSWPHLMEAIVVRVSDASKTYECNSEPSKSEERSFRLSCHSIKEHNSSRLAIDVGPITQLVHVKIAIGTEYVLQDYGFVLKKLWNNIDMAYPAQTIVRDLQDVMKNEKSYVDMQEMLPVDCTVFLRATEFYGSMGNVVDFSPSTNRLQARFLVYDEPDLGPAFDVHCLSLRGYRNVDDTAAATGISVGLLLQLTGSLLVAPGGHRGLNAGDKAVNIGLRLRLMSKEEETVGYSKKINKTWYFSDKTVALIEKYLEQFPSLPEKFHALGRTKVFFETDLFGEGNEGKLKELNDWLNTQDHVNAERRSCSIIALEQNAIAKLVELIDEHEALHQPKVKTMFVNPKELYRPGMKQAKLIDPSTRFELLDRVIVVQDKEDVPVGARGTVIGMHRVSDPNPVRREAIGQWDVNLEILFDKPFYKGVGIGGISRTEKRITRLVQGAVLNISCGKQFFGNRYKGRAQESIRNEEKLTAVPSTTNGSSYITGKMASIHQRLHERIGKTTNKDRNIDPSAVVSGHQGYHNISTKQKETDTKQPQKVEFERLWKKLKESSKHSGPLFDDNDIESFVQSPRQFSGNRNVRVSTERSDEKAYLSCRVKHDTTPNNGPKHGEQKNVPMDKVSFNWSEKHDTEPNNGSWRVEQRSEDNMAGYLKQMLRIDDKSVQSKNEMSAFSPSTIVVPAPASLPKPPIQWQTMPTSKSASASLIPEQHLIQNAQPVHTAFGFRPMMGPPVHFTAPQQPSMPMQPAFAPAGLRMRNENHPFVGFQPPPFAQRMPMHSSAPFANRVEMGRTPYQQQEQHYRHQQQNSPHLQQHPSTWGPKGPQHLTNNDNNPPGKGAFVPLQALKKKAESKSSTTVHNSSNSDRLTGNNYVKAAVAQPASSNNSGSFNEKNARRRQEVEQKQAEVKQGFATFLSQKSDTKQLKNRQNSAAVGKTNVKSRPKTRIAARFDDK
ncbi:5'-3' exoribonuclease 1 [Anopheles maculipalpis]|uniref:5'-3' exoribonuclease 1 n=1 Tax=Anopheles maculipalpis TaxID=1496333 RepID=UPI002159585E|nr:5'-3' exoribonuclease 1 [Anopheles maculipalpis]